MDGINIGRLNGRFVVSWWAGGKRRRYRLDAQDAKAAEREAIDVYRRETAKPAGGLTVAQVWDAYREHLGERRAAKAMESEWKALRARFGHLRPDQVTAALCGEHTAARRAVGIKDGTIWTELGRLRSAFKWAADQRPKLIAEAPPVPRPPKPAPKDRWLTREEIAKLLAVPMAGHIRLAILLMLGTAARPSAALELTWDRVDFERGKIDLRVDADGPRKGRAIVPINAGLRAALSEAYRSRTCEHVIEWNGKAVTSIKTGLNNALAAAELEGVTPHVFRHTAAVHMAAADRPMERIAQYLGHSNVATTRHVYARFAPSHMQEEAEVLDFAPAPAKKAKVR